MRLGEKATQSMVRLKLGYQKLSVCGRHENIKRTENRELFSSVQLLSRVRLFAIP